MAVLERNSDAFSLNLTVRGPVGRDDVDRLRAVLVATESGRAVDLDLREVTDFPRLGIALLVSARRWFGDRLHIRGNAAMCRDGRGRRTRPHPARRGLNSPVASGPASAGGQVSVLARSAGTIGA